MKILLNREQKSASLQKKKNPTPKQQKTKQNKPKTKQREVVHNETLDIWNLKIHTRLCCWYQDIFLRTK